jgi:hypothetical protein
LFWRVPKGDGTALLEVEPALFGRTVKVSEDRREIARFAKPTGQQPWVEHALPGNERSVVLVLVWDSSVISSHLFVDGRNLRGGDTIETWRSRAPKPIDRFEQNVLRSSALNEDNDAWRFFALGLVVGGVAGWAAGSILIMVIVSAGAALLVTGWTSLVRRFAVWLGTKPTWNDGLRAEAVFLFMISPMVLLVAIGIIATSH